MHAVTRIRDARSIDASSLTALATLVVGERRAPALVREHLARQQLLVADDGGAVVGLLAYRTDWFQCAFVDLVVVAEHTRRCGVARALFDEVARHAPGPRLFSSTEETNVDGIRMHRALGFVSSGHIDNLPQGYRELLFYKRLHG